MLIAPLFRNALAALGALFLSGCVHGPRPGLFQGRGECGTQCASEYSRCVRVGCHVLMLLLLWCPTLGIDSSASATRVVCAPHI